MTEEILISKKLRTLDYFIIYIIVILAVLVFVTIIIPDDKIEYHTLTVLPFDNYDRTPIEKFSYSIENSDKVILSGNATYNSTLKVPASEGINIIYLWSDEYYVSKIVTTKINGDNATMSNFYPQLYRKGIIKFDQKGKLSEGNINLVLSVDSLFNDPLYCYSGYKANLSIIGAVYSTRVPKEFEPLSPTCFIVYNKLENNSINLEINANSINKIIFTVHDVDYFKVNNTWYHDIEDLNGKDIGGKTYVHVME